MCEAWIAISWFVPRTSFSVRTPACFMASASTCSALRPYKVRPAAESLPGRWETGTQNHEGMAGVTAAVEYLAELGRRHAPEAQGQRAALLAAYDAHPRIRAEAA